MEILFVFEPFSRMMIDRGSASKSNQVVHFSSVIVRCVFSYIFESQTT